MRHYDREQFRHLNDSERYRDYDYTADDAWIGANERAPHGLTTAHEPPWSTHGPYATRPFIAERAWDEDRKQGRDYGRDLGLGYGRDYNIASEHERMSSEPYDTRALPRGGPKNWHRSDARILDDVCHALTAHGWIDAGEIEVRVESGEVILSGTAPDLETKYLAEDVSDDVPGVRGVQNTIRVFRRAQRTGTTGSHAASSTAASRR